MPPHVRAQSARDVGLDTLEVRPFLGVVRQFHDTIVKTPGFIPADMQDVNQAGMSARNGLELLNAEKLAVKRAGQFKVLAPDDLHGAVGTRDTLSQPNLTIGTGADALDQRVIGDDEVVTVRWRPAIHWPRPLGRARRGGQFDDGFRLLGGRCCAGRGSVRWWQGRGFVGHSVVRRIRSLCAGHNFPVRGDRKIMETRFSWRGCRARWRSPVSDSPNLHEIQPAPALPPCPRLLDEFCRRSCFGTSAPEGAHDHWRMLP